MEFNVEAILASLGEEAVVEIPEGETPESVAVIVKTIGGDGKGHLRSGGTSRWTQEGRKKAEREGLEKLYGILRERSGSGA